MKNGSVDLPDEVPVMPLPGAVLFPHALLPLYIFEPRYRKMLEHALQRDRMFSVTLIKPSCPEWHAPEDFFHFATVGLIRACVGRDDGTSNLVLQGLHRTVCDYVAGMNDRYLMEEYARITGERDSLQQVGAVHPNRPGG